MANDTQKKQQRADIVDKIIAIEVFLSTVKYTAQYGISKDNKETIELFYDYIKNANSKN